uniref:Secreted protein n=1 Tax=Picea glauca TaxID=3330 RepID=A0A117NI42_PICGL|nr:hypothetical protein ABT39_MTgene3874 [Picea glauca]QHR90882.1 hypothetical protein Q903MT_gene4909 [Picea sitchensis]
MEWMLQAGIRVMPLLLLALELKPEKLGKEFQGRNQQYADQWFREVHWTHCGSIPFPYVVWNSLTVCYGRVVRCMSCAHGWSIYIPLCMIK